MRTSFLLLILGVVGCSGSGDGPGLVGVSGTVTIDGTPVEQGTIAFVSESGGRTAVTQITNGQYELLEADGALPGTQKVSIQAYRKTGKVTKITKSLPRAPEEAVPTEPIEVEETEQILPERYNSKSVLRAVLPDSVNRDIDFELTLEPDPETVTPTSPDS